MERFISGPFSGILWLALGLVLVGVVGWLRWRWLSVHQEELQEDGVKNIMLSRVVEQSPMSIMLTNATGEIEYVNPFFEETYGYRLDEVLGLNPRVLSAGKTSSDVYQEMWGTLLKGCTWQGELLNRKKSGEELWEFVTISPVKNERNELSGYASVKEDLSLLKAKEAQLFQTTYYDSVTGLPNRLLAIDRLSQALLQARRHEKIVLLVFFDLDHFKKVNDLVGFEDGNALLLLVAERLKGCIRSTDTVARYNADEFVLILQDIPSVLVAEQLVRNVMSVMDETFVMRGQEFSLSASVGASLFPNDADDAYTLLQRAEQAMEKAKESGRGSFHFFTQTMNLVATQRIVMEHGLRMALIRKELSLVFQPILDVATEQLVSAEVLLRWNSPSLGRVSPEKFIGLAEDIGLIGALGEWVLETACRHLKAWQEAGYVIPKLAVNVSPQQFQSPDFVSTVQRALLNAGVEASCLEIEITESATITSCDEATVLQTFGQLQQMGIGFSIDDFGTGYSSLSYLKRYPFDTLKIDRSFVFDVEYNQDSKMLVSTMISMAHSLGMRVIGEGVENTAHVQFLQEHECDWVQGYLYAKPMNAADFAQYLKNRCESCKTPSEIRIDSTPLPAAIRYPLPTEKSGEKPLFFTKHSTQE